MSPRRSIQDQLSQLQRDCRACTRCVQDGFLEAASPTFEGRWDARLMLVGQAPGQHEVETLRPFSGRAGKELDRWMVRAGFESAAEFRRRTYIAAVMRCFPGRHPKGGDRRPPAGAVANCASWLEAELELVQPRVVIAVGQLAIERFLGRGPLEDRVGRSFGRHPVIVPLPHPSGQSRWLNQAENRERLERGLAALQAAVETASMHER